VRYLERIQDTTNLRVNEIFLKVNECYIFVERSISTSGHVIVDNQPSGKGNPVSP